MKLFGLGNPLLDISANVTQDLLDKYGLKMNDAILAEEKHLPIYDELVATGAVQYIAGGATQNTIRVAQWMMGQEGATGFSGCVGKDTSGEKLDKFGEQLSKCAEQDGVQVFYARSESNPTGLCACLIKDTERSLCTNLQAANDYKLENLTSEPINSAWKSASHYYSSGFFLTVSAEAAMTMAKHAAAEKKVYSVNLAAPFIPQFFKQPLADLIEFSDFVFGNESEAEAFGKANEYEDCSVEAVAEKIANLKLGEGKTSRTVVITQGSKSTFVFESGKKEGTNYAVTPMSKEMIVDTNGAGDAFVGGFLSQLVQGRDMETCVNTGHYSAGKIIQVSGTTLEGKPDYDNKKVKK